MQAAPGTSIWSNGPLAASVVGFLVAGLMAVSLVAISPVLTLGLAVGVAGGLFFLVRPTQTLLAAIVFRVFLDILWWVPFTVGGLNLSQIFSGAVFAMLVIIVLLRAPKLKEHPAAKWAFAMIGLLTLATARAIELSADVDILVRYYTTPLMLLATVQVFDTAAIRRRLVWLMSVAALVPIGQSMYQLAAGASDYVLHGYLRLLGGYQNIHNHALVMMCFSLLFLAWYQAGQRWWVRYGALAVAGACTVAIYYTYTRTGLLGWAVSVLAVLLVQKRYNLVGAAVLLGSIFVLMDPDVQARFADLLAVFDPNVESVDRRALGSGRWGLWSWSMAEYLSFPVADVLMGLGLGGHRLTTLDWSRSFSRVGLTLDPHNDYLLLLYQMGPLGVVVYLGMLWVSFYAAWYVARNAQDLWARSYGAAVAGLSVGVLVTNGVSNSFLHRSAPGWYYWCFAGIVLAEYVEVRRQVLARQKERARPVPVPAPEG